MIRIYIAGNIAGEDLDKCKAKFAIAENKLRELGAIPISPFKLGCQDHWTFEECKPYNFKAIRKCHAIFILNDWTKSPGARTEIKEATSLKLDLFYDCDEDFQEIANQVEIALVG